MTRAAGPGPKRRWQLTAGILALVFQVTGARAESVRVVLAQPAAPDEVVAEVATRVRAELAAAAFEVVVITFAPGSNPREQVEAAGLEPRPIATLAIVRIEDRPAVDVWVYDRLTDKTLVKRLDLGKRADAEITSALAIHAVELLRASLLETRARSRASASTAAGAKSVPREVKEWVEHAVEPPTTLLEGRTIAIAGAVLHSFAGIGPAFAPALRLSLGAPSGLAGRLSVIGPALVSNLEGPRGRANVRQELAMIEIVYAPSHHWLSPFASLGAGGYHLYTHGWPTDSGRDSESTDDAWAALIDAGVGLAARLGSSAAVSLDLHAFVTEPGWRVGIVDDVIGPAGRPSFVASLGMQSNF